MRRDCTVLYDILNICAQGYDWSTYHPGRGYSKEEFDYHIYLIFAEKLIDGEYLTWRGNDVLDKIEEQRYWKGKIDDLRKEKERHAKENLK
ncbi:hypothetical protein [Parasutterella excrementihominis]|jgi:hypothetical protein|uniref:hypothetical protein n=1 Tax=Parasutterella excrementihominis TaxID=487175 RepID=UPI003A9150C9